MPDVDLIDWKATDLCEPATSFLKNKKHILQLQGNSVKFEGSVSDELPYLKISCKVLGRG